jgi:hypothetical protein
VPPPTAHDSTSAGSAHDGQSTISISSTCH